MIEPLLTERLPRRHRKRPGKEVRSSGRLATASGADVSSRLARRGVSHDNTLQLLSSSHGGRSRRASAHTDLHNSRGHHHTTDIPNIPSQHSGHLGSRRSCSSRRTERSLCHSFVSGRAVSPPPTCPYRGFETAGGTESAHEVGQNAFAPMYDPCYHPPTMSPVNDLDSSIDVWDLTIL